MTTRSCLVLGMLVSAACFGVLYIAYYPRVSTSIRITHTEFLMNQIRDILPEERLLKTKADLIALVSSQPIDWNSCRLENGEILDAWEVPMRVVFGGDGATITLISAGPDGRFGTADDLMETMDQRK